mmetsp:Transcript_13226/g.26558  ORF Transcript_13226/g.26558 Transcript_13226/m.26558 type:complete len:117 (+) Transcript_13226:4447-4797(+)
MTVLVAWFCFRKQEHRHQRHQQKATVEVIQNQLPERYRHQAVEQQRKQEQQDDDDDDDSSSSLVSGAFLFLVIVNTTHVTTTGLRDVIVGACRPRFLSLLRLQNYMKHHYYNIVVE